MTSNEAPGRLLFAQGLLEPQVDIYPICEKGCCFPVVVEIAEGHGHSQYRFTITTSLERHAGRPAVLKEAVSLARAKHAAMRGSLMSLN